MPRDSDNLIIDLGRLERIVRQAVREALADLDANQRSRPRFVTLAQAARLYGIGPRTLRQHIRARRLHGYAPGGSRAKLLIDTGELEAFIKAAAVDRDRHIDALANEAIAELEASSR